MSSHDDDVHVSINTGLTLALITYDHDHDHQEKEKEKRNMTIKKHLSFKYDQSLPSLSLALSSPEDHTNHHHQQQQQQASSVSSFSNTSVKREKEELAEVEVEERVVCMSMCSRVISDEEYEEGSPRKKLRLTKQQSATLEDSFKQHTTLNPKQKQVLAAQLNLRPRQVEVWFQNRRARTKLKQTEEDCELLKKCCQTLTEENKRLHKELQELKALKLTTSLYMQIQPAATLTMCPSCDRIVGTATTSTAANHEHHFLNPFTHPSAAC